MRCTMKVLRTSRLPLCGTVLGVGTALCVALPLDLAEADDTALERPGFSLVTRDGSGDTGLYTSIAIGGDGLGLVSYYDATNGDLKVAHCVDIACTSATLKTLDHSGNVGQYSSLTIGIDKLPLITYYDGTNGDLKIAHCTDVACEAATITVLTFLQAEENVGQYTSVTIAGGQGLISYYDATDRYLKSALCPDLSCTEPTLTTTPDKTGDVGRFSSVAIGTDSRPLISYYDATNGDLKVIHCEEVVCVSPTRTVLESEGNVGQYTSIVIGADGLALISYYDVTNGDLKVAHCGDVACTSATLATPDRTGNVGSSTSVAIGTDGLPLISYYDVTNGDLKVAHCGDVGCTDATVTPLDGAAINVGASSAMVLG